MAAVALVLASAPSSLFAAGLEGVPLPGSALALARTVGIDVPVDPARVLADAVRTLYHSPEDDNETARAALESLRAARNTLDEFHRLLRSLSSERQDIALAQAATREGREPLDRLLEFLHLRRREIDGKSRVETRSGRAGAARVEVLRAFGVNLSELETRLNAGETVRLTLPVESVAVPFTPEFWGRVIFERAVEPTALVTTILLDRRAALLAHGLLGLDGDTLAYLASEPDLVRQLYAKHAHAFAGFAGRVVVREGRVVTPGGARAVPLWEAVLGVRVDEPARFIRTLFSAEGGRLAYVYDVIANLDDARQAFAFGTWIANDRTARERFASLVSAALTGDVTWALDRTPFNRPVYDVAHLLTTIRVGADGTPAPPASRRFWRVVFETSDIPDDPRRELGDPARDGTIDAAWLVEQLTPSDSRTRRTRIEQLALGQRAFGTVDVNALPEALVSLTALWEFPALVRTLDRMGIRDPHVYAAAVARSQALSGLGGRDAFVSVSQFQGSLAIVARLCQVRALTAAEGGALVVTLADRPLTNGRYQSGIAAWIEERLLPALHVGDGPYEPALLSAAAGLSGDPASVRISWEGRLHEVSVAKAERDRLTRVRDRQGGPTLDQVLDLHHVVRGISQPGASLDVVANAVPLLRAMAPTFITRGADEMPPGVDPPRGGADAITESARSLSRTTETRDRPDVARAIQPLVDAVDEQLAEILRSITYAFDIGESDGRLMAGGNVSLRHDFGLAERAPLQATLRWVEPFQTAPAGERWRVSGALLGLNLAFGPQSLRRISAGAARAPRVGSNERLTFIKGAALLRTDSFRDDDQRSLAAAISKGQARVESTAGDAGAFDRLAQEVRMDHWRQNAARWQIATRPDAAREYFSMVELLALGGGPPPNGDAWGAAAASGCWCTTLVGTNMVWALTGRSQVGVLPAAVPDLNLRVASILTELGLPAELAKGVLAFALQDYLDTAAPVDAHDWLALVRAARALTEHSVADYVAALAVRGPLRLVATSSDGDR